MDTQQSISSDTGATGPAELYIVIPSHGSLADRAQSAGSDLQACRHREVHNTQQNKCTDLKVSRMSRDLTVERVSFIYYMNDLEMKPSLNYSRIQ